jgi:hypothetical protein
MSLPFGICKLRSTTPSVKLNYNTGRTGHSGRRIELTLCALEVSGRFKAIREVVLRLIFGCALGHRMAEVGPTRVSGKS